MDKHDIEILKARNNIVDVVSKYVSLKKNGKNHIGLCPFHSEKTPSFTVDESKQFYHCFGCGAHGDVITFVREYTGSTFKDACKQLGADVEIQPASEILKNLKKAKNAKTFRVPSDNKQDGDLANRILSKCVIESVGGVDFYKYRGGFVLPVYNADYELVNAVKFADGETMSFVAGGFTYGGFTPIRMNKSNKWLACVALSDARKIAHEQKVNVAVCWNSHSLKYLCKWNNSELQVTPIIRPDLDDDYLCYQMDWIKLTDKMEKMQCLN